MQAWMNNNTKLVIISGVVPLELIGPNMTKLNFIGFNRYPSGKGRLQNLCFHKAAEMHHLETNAEDIQLE